MKYATDFTFLAATGSNRVTPYGRVRRTASLLRSRLTLRRWKNEIHARHKSDADAAYAQLKQAGKRDLDARTSRTIHEYCSEVLGSSKFQPWMRVYALYQGRFTEGCIPGDYFEMKVLPALFKRHAPVGRKRTLSRRLFGTDLFPDVAYYVNGQWFTTDFSVIAKKRLLDVVFAESDEVYAKVEGSLEGKGVRRLARADFESAADQLLDDCVLQKPVTQHAWFDSIYSGAVATVRVTTSYTCASGPRLRASYLRMGYAGRAWVQSAKQLRCSVVDGEGSLAPEALDEVWRPHSVHPESGFVFRGSRIPCFDKAVRSCLELHSKLPHDQIVGWDVAIAKGGTVAILEWNSKHPDIKFSEATVGPIFADCRFDRL